MKSILLYFSYSFPAEHRMRLNSIFILSLPMAFALSSALAGFNLGLDRVLGIRDGNGSPLPRAPPP